MHLVPHVHGLTATITCMNTCTRTNIRIHPQLLRRAVPHLLQSSLKDLMIQQIHQVSQYSLIAVLWELPASHSVSDAEQLVCLTFLRIKDLYSFHKLVTVCVYAFITRYIKSIQL